MVKKKSVSKAEIARFLGVKEAAVDSLRRNEGLPFITLNARTLVYDLEAVAEWMRKKGIQHYKAEKQRVDGKIKVVSREKISA
jgi:phage terminase Nu1 subunit (DNA packaging protein)